MNLTDIRHKTLTEIANDQAALVAHTTGSGKTRLGIAWQPDLVVAPAHLIPKWRDEASLFGLQIPIISYTRLYRCLSEEGVWRCGRIVMDEAHELKGLKKKALVLGSLLKADRLLFLTATPASISLEELRNLRLVAREITGAPEIRIYKDTVPPPVLPPVELYYWSGGYIRPIFPVGPRPTYDYGTADYPATGWHVRQMIEDFSTDVSPVSRVIIFSSTRALAHDIGVDFQCPVVHGENSPAERMKIIDEWRASGNPYLSVTWQSSGVGLDIPEADLAVVTEVPWTPLILTQIVGRLRRTGRTMPATVLCYAPGCPKGIKAMRRLINRAADLQGLLAPQIDQTMGALTE